MNDIVASRTATRDKVRRLPGVEGIWIFVLIDMSVFALLFLSYVLERVNQPALFARSQQVLDVRLGLINMVVLLTSSWLVALAVHAARENRQKLAARFLSLAFVCGLTFAVIKVFEYTLKFQAGISMLTNDFFMFYFIMTFIHFLHVLAGMVVLAIMAMKARRGGYGGEEHVQGLEVGATYWHMVDLLWVMLFPLLYMAN